MSNTSQVPAYNQGQARYPVYSHPPVDSKVLNNILVQLQQNQAAIKQLQQITPQPQQPSTITGRIESIVGNVLGWGTVALFGYAVYRLGLPAVDQGLEKVKGYLPEDTHKTIESVQRDTRVLRELPETAVAWVPEKKTVEDSLFVGKAITYTYIANSFYVPQIVKGAVMLTVKGVAFVFGRYRPQQ